MNQPLVSILIPCYNAAAFVAEAIQSAQAQTYPHTEIIVVDDGSSDHSVEVVRSFGEAVHLEAGPNRGACAARNRALALSRGEFIQFLDADDMLEPTKLEKQLPLLIAGQADLVFCKGFLFGDDRPLRPKKKPIASPVGVDPFLYCLSTGLSTEGPLHQRRGLEAVGGFRPGLQRAQEYDLHLRLAATGVRIHLLDEWLYRHRNHEGPRITRTQQPADHMVRLLLQLAAELEKGPPYSFETTRRQALAATLLQHSIWAFRNGAEAVAHEGVATALRLAPQLPVPGDGWRGILARLVGPLRAEALLKRARRVRSCLKRERNLAERV